MKITKVSVLHVHMIQTDPGEKGQRPILVRIDTDEGNRNGLWLRRNGCSRYGS